MRPRAAGGPVRLPTHAAGLRIGLYGGSFDPAHAGHRHVATVALRRLRLDRVWWIVTPGNPLKDRSRLPSRAERLAPARTMARHPRMSVIDVEGRIGSVYTVETVRLLARRCPKLRLVWIMGADSLANLHRWREWREIMALVPIAIVDRPGWTLRALRAPAAAAFAGARIDEARASSLASLRPPAWVFLHGPRSRLSSTALRENAGQGAQRR